MRDYSYYANKVFAQAMTNPHVDASNVDEVCEYSEEIAHLLVLDEEKLRAEVRRLARM